MNEPAKSIPEGENCTSCRYWNGNPGQIEGMAFCHAQIGKTEADFSCQDWREKGRIVLGEPQIENGVDSEN